MRMAYYCACGARITSMGGKKGVKQAIDTWLEAHQGDGHSKVTESKCRHARMSNERKRIAADRKAERAE